MSYDIIIIGGGITGLYLSYLLNSLNQINPIKKRVLLLEKEERLGGRIKTHRTTWKNRKYIFEEGASRFNQYHKNMKQLIHELKLETYIHSISGQYKYYPNDNPSNKDTKNINQRIDTNMLLIIDHMEKEKDEDLQKTIFEEYALRFIQKEDVREIINSTGYYAEYKRMNAYDFLRLYKKWINPKIQYYSLSCGLDKIIDELEETVKDNIDIHKGEYGHVLQIEKIKENHKVIGYYVHTKKRIYKTKCCVLALPKNILLQLSILKPIQKKLNSIYETPLCRIYSFYSSKNIWWKDLKSKITTKTPIRMIIPIKENLIMSSYSDDIYADKWDKIDHDNNHDNHSGINKYITKYTRDIFGNHIQEPEDSKIFYWKYGVGCWKKNIDSSSMYHQIIEPFYKMNESFYICGENYSLNQGWIEGALEMTSDVYKRLITRLSSSMSQEN